jgi:hypothetical protein
MDVRRAQQLAVAAAVAVVAALGMAPQGHAGRAHLAADVVQRTPSGVLVHSTLVLPDGDPPHTMGHVVAAGSSRASVVGLAEASSGGWWEAAADGGVFTSGGVGFLGSAGGLALVRPIVGMAATPDAGGYWLVASDGGVFTYGDAHFFGSAGALPLRQPIVAMTATPDAGGYWLVASDGGVFTYGDAHFFGSAGALPLRQPIVGMAATPDGAGYWLVAADGGVFTYGDAKFFGAPSTWAAAIVPTPSGAGYWVADRMGHVWPFGDAPAIGDASGMLAAPVASAAGAGGQVRVVATDGSSAVLAAGAAATVSASPMLVAHAAGAASSYTFMATGPDGAPARWDPCTPVHYVTNLAEAPAGAAAVIAGALAQVSAATGLTFVNDGATTEVPTANRQAYQPGRYGQRWAPVVIAWARPSDTDVLPGGNIIGEGGSSWVQVGGGPKVYVSGEAVIDSANTGVLAASFGAGSTLGELMLHELGHVTGLGHTTDSAQVMYPVLEPLPAAAYGAGDLAGLSQLGAARGCLSVPAPS